ncbi:HAD-like domain-containing protein [Mucor mucedo]|uniref:HAD-like domain-containing protein n=1 Tax=Mucor mucedo TaxID=29922 RepID=UPI002220114C|nr:HAD-like domain-containing protein [Mucor mucedo]KAI7887577.1 HAD-like domain-containing protein [Mucor mucedo]
MTPPANTHYYRTKGFIYDLDGTLIDTIPLVERHWHQFALEHGLDGNKILETSHGVRTIETMARWTPDKATAEHADMFEKKLAEESEGVSILPGVSALLQKTPIHKWGICTGGNQYMARKRLEQCQIHTPDAFVCGDMVSKGKPDPEGYSRVAKELGLEGKDVIVFEDAPSGVKSARAAGATVIACATTHSVDQLKEAGAHSVVHFLTDVDFTSLPDGTFEVEVKNAL